MNAQYKLASHNTMSYLKPTKWYMYPFRWVAKCQDKTIDEQYVLGIRMFDIRIKFTEDYTPIFAHGLIDFKGVKVFDILNKINNWGDCYVRIVFEESYYKPTTLDYSYEFKKLVDIYMSYFKNIKFFEGTRKYDWYQIVPLYKLTPTPKYIQNISSMSNWLFKGWYPRLYAMFNNKKSKRQAEINAEQNKDEWIFIDFIGKYYK